LGSSAVETGCRRLQWPGAWLGCGTDRGSTILPAAGPVQAGFQSPPGLFLAHKRAQYRGKQKSGTKPGLVTESNEKIMNAHRILIAFLGVVLLCSGCKEDTLNPPVEKDKVAPGPVSNLKVENLP